MGFAYDLYDECLEWLARSIGVSRARLETEEAVVNGLTLLMMASSVVVLLWLLVGRQPAAYGRHSASALLAWTMPSARLAWFLQEVPSFLMPLIALYRLPHHARLSAFAVGTEAMFLLHYFQRTFIYVALMRGSKPNVPVHLFLLGFIFCTWNGYIQGTYHAFYATFHNYCTVGYYARFLGIPIYLLGLAVNIDSDRRLRNLRKDKTDNSYKIPYGGLFRYVSSPNYLGEIVEWIGYALFAQTAAALAFAMFTLANTLPRGISHHRWYLQKFEDYPKDRRAVIPFVC